MKYKTILLFNIISILVCGAARARPCSSGTSDDIAMCRYDKLKASEKTLEKYINAAYKRLDQQKKSNSLDVLHLSQKNWSSFRKGECDAVEQFFYPGTISDIMKIDCLQRLTDARIHEVWSNWLRYMDNTPPILPEPRP